MPIITKKAETHLNFSLETKSYGKAWTTVPPFTLEMEFFLTLDGKIGHLYYLFRFFGRF